MAALTTASDINSFEELRAVVDDVMEGRMIYRFIVVRSD